MTLRSGVGSCVLGPRASAGVVRRHGEMVCDVQGGFGEGFFAVGAGGLRVEDGELNVVEFRKPAEALLLHPDQGTEGLPSTCMALTWKALDAPSAACWG